MASKERLVFDTSSVVSALLMPRSVPRQAFDKALSEGTVLVSAATIAELNDVLRRPKFDRYVHEEERIEFLSAYVAAAELVETTESVTECRDPKDDMFLELAASGKATCIVTGDQDLLVLHPWRGIAIITASDFLSGTREK